MVNSYEKYYCAFIDILGWKEIIKNFDQAKFVLEACQAYNQLTFALTKNTGTADQIKWTIFSDSIIIGIKSIHENALLNLIIFCTNLQKKLICKHGIKLRGGIAQIKL